MLLAAGCVRKRTKGSGTLHFDGTIRDGGQGFHLMSVAIAARRFVSAVPRILCHQLQSHVRNPHQHFMPFCPPPPRQQGFTVFDLTLTKVRTRLNYKPQDMSAAIADVQRGKLVRMAAVEHGVPLSSLYLRLKQQSSGGQQQSCEVPQQFVVRQQQSIGGKYDLVREQLPAGRQQQSDGGQQQLAERQQQSSGQQRSLEKQQVENRDDHQSQSSSVLRLPSERQHTAGLADSQQIATRHIPNAQLDSQASIAADHIHSGNSPNYFSSESR
ncbi:hypothetical protein BaRGS_00035379 [Batillaria attramentaria]|uniref:HTH psq-type domain-containing protein n=1 Tax=Batillaria attramentaria TaxID=370345 RepID=A0ABD0JER9_9CAEN